MLELYQWGPGFDKTSFDPFCLSIQAYLNCNGIKWVSNECYNPSISPLGILPVLKSSGNSSQIVSGTNAIVEFLKERGHDLDEDLTPKELAESLGFITLIQGKLYDALLYNWWHEGDNYLNNTCPTIQKNMSFLSARLLPSKLRERVLARLKNYGTVPFNSKERIPRVYANARQIFKALADRLGENEFFFGGSKPTTLDCIAYGHLSLHAYPSLKVPTLFSMLTFEFPSLIAYCARVESRFSLPIIKSPFQKPSFHELLGDFFNNPTSYITWVLNGFYSTLEDEQLDQDSKSLKVQRIKRFYNGLSVVGGLAFFSFFIQKHGISFRKNSEGQEEQEGDDEDDFE